MFNRLSVILHGNERKKTPVHIPDFAGDDIFCQHLDAHFHGCFFTLKLTEDKNAIDPLA